VEHELDTVEAEEDEIVKKIWEIRGRLDRAATPAARQAQAPRRAETSVHLEAFALRDPETGVHARETSVHAVVRRLNAVAATGTLFT
jgi:hypothetical protein